MALKKLLMSRTAILYQAKPAPAVDGMVKPFKPGGGYSDSGADIACALGQRGLPLVLPVGKPDIQHDLDWVFADMNAGIREALRQGAEVLWSNTVLYEGHRYDQSSLSVIAARASGWDYGEFLANILRQQWNSGALLYG